jgi:hypothetical protein
MNDRIKELADQATDKEHGYSFFDREKFAELIVRECMDICNDIAEEYEHDDSDDYNVGKTESAIACRNHIYKRFMWSKE